MSGTVLSHFKFIISFNPHNNHLYFYYSLPHFIEEENEAYGNPNDLPRVSQLVNRRARILIQ